MTPLPNPANYPDETALNRQIMNEDWDANQERFREAPPTKKKDATLADRLDDVAGDVQCAMDALALISLDVQDMQKKTSIVTDPDGVVRILSDFVNVGQGRGEAFAEALGKEHRTIQQGVTRLFVQWMRYIYDTDNKAGLWHDERNKASVILARKMFNMLDEDDFYLPMI